MNAQANALIVKIQAQFAGDEAKQAQVIREVQAGFNAAIAQYGKMPMMLSRELAKIAAQYIR